MSLQLEWEEDVDENVLDGFDIDQWMETDNEEDIDIDNNTYNQDQSDNNSNSNIASNHDDINHQHNNDMNDTDSKKENHSENSNNMDNINNMNININPTTNTAISEQDDLIELAKRESLRCRANNMDPNTTKYQQTQLTQSDDSDSNSFVFDNQNNHNTNNRIKNEYKCPLCNEICDTFKALQVHANHCCSTTSNTQNMDNNNNENDNNHNKNEQIYKCPVCNDTFNDISICSKHTNICIEHQKTKENQQKQWQNILNMNNTKKRSRNTDDEDIRYEIPSKKRKINLPSKPTISSMKKNNGTHKKMQIQPTLEDVAGKFFAKRKSVRKRRRNRNIVSSDCDENEMDGDKENISNENIVTPGFDIDLFPSEQDCMETDEKSSELEIKQKLKDKDINNKVLKKSFLSLNGMNDIINNEENKKKENENDINNDILNDEFLSPNEESLNSFNSSPDKYNYNENNDDPLSPIMVTIDDTQGMENVVLSETMKSEKKRKYKKLNKKEIKFIPPWDIK